MPKPKTIAPAKIIDSSQDEDLDMFEPREDASPFGAPGDCYDYGPD